VAAAERWHLEDQGTHKVLVIGYEDWPFPVPLVKAANKWHFDTAAGKEEVLARRIGRNELAAMGICKVYVKAQHQYARTGHDGKAAGAYAAALRSDPGKQNGLYWPPVKGQPRSPLGDLIAEAADEGKALADKKDPASPFYGYYFKILT